MTTKMKKFSVGDTVTFVTPWKLLHRDKETVTDEITYGPELMGQTFKVVKVEDVPLPLQRDVGHEQWLTIEMPDRARFYSGWFFDEFCHGEDKPEYVQWHNNLPLSDYGGEDK